jgi:general secretion pathway protein L
MMQVGAIWGRWIEVLAGVLFAWREIWRGRRALIVSQENNRLVVRQAAPGQDRCIPQAGSEEVSSISSVLRNPVTPPDREPGGLISDTSLSIDLSISDDLRFSPPGPGETIRIDDPEGTHDLETHDQEKAPAGSVLAVLSVGTPVPDEVAQAASSGFVILELPADKVVVRRINVPAQAREFLPGIVRNQVERLSPWQADQTVYGFDAETSREDAAALDVRVFITSRAALDSKRDELDAMGLPVDRIVAREGGIQAAAPVTLWSRIADAPRETVERTRRQIGAAIPAVVLLSVGLSLWAFSSAASIRGESDDLAARSRTLQRQLQGSRSPQALASLPPAERAWAWKETAPSAVIVLEVLSRALPDAAYLTELRLDNTTLRIIGLASDPPSLIAPLERTGHLTSVHFFAPTTRGPDGTLFKFHIEAQVVPRLEITGN